MSEEDTDGRYQQLLDQMSEMYKLHVDEKHAIENTFEIKLINMEKHWISIVNDERKRFGTIRDEKMAEADTSKLQIERITNAYEAQIAQLSKQLTDSNRSWQKEYDRVCDLLATDGRKFEVAMDEQERILDQQMQDVQTMYKEQLVNENTKVAEALNQVGALKGHIQVLKSAKVPADLDPVKLHAKISDLELKLRNANSKIATLEGTVKTKCSSLAESHQEISRLKEVQSSLEKFRSSLYSQLKDFEVLKSEAESRAAEMDAALRGAEGELATLKHQSTSYASRSNESEQRAKHSLSQLLDAKQRLALVKNKNERFVRAVGAEISAEPDGRLKSQLSRLIATHAAEKEDADLDPVIREVTLQRDALSRKFENSLVGLARASKELEKTRIEMIDDNSQLIGILNEAWKIKTAVEAELSRRHIPAPTSPVVNQVVRRARELTRQTRQSAAPRDPTDVVAPPVHVTSLRKPSTLQDSTQAPGDALPEPASIVDDDSDFLYLGGPINPSNLFPPLPPNKHLHHAR